jgi:hypothetical protein
MPVENLTASLLKSAAAFIHMLLFKLKLIFHCERSCINCFHIGIPIIIWDYRLENSYRNISCRKIPTPTGIFPIGIPIGKIKFVYTCHIFLLCYQQQNT